LQTLSLSLSLCETAVVQFFEEASMKERIIEIILEVLLLGAFLAVAQKDLSFCVAFSAWLIFTKLLSIQEALEELKMKTKEKKEEKI
jgi:hypothetical protein